MGTITLKILELFENNPTQAFTIHNVSQLLKRTYPFVHKKVNLLIKDKVLTKKIVGRAHQVSPNLKNEKTILLFAVNSQQHKARYLEKNSTRDVLREFINKLKTNNIVKAIVLFGSYAKGQETKKSDIDVLVITAAKTREVDEFILRMANTVNMAFGSQINPVVVDDTMFMEMLKKPEELTVGKEVLKAHIILYGFEHFWTIVGGAL